MGNRVRTCGGRDSRRHHVLRWSSLIGLRSVAHLWERYARQPRGSIGELVYIFWTGSTMLKVYTIVNADRWCIKRLLLRG